MNKTDVINEVSKLKLKPGSYVVFSGSSLAMRDIRDAADVDILARPNVLTLLKDNGWEERDQEDGTKFMKKGNVEVVANLIKKILDVKAEKIINDPEYIDGIPCSKLEYELMLKKRYGRVKDQKDIDLIKKYLHLRK